MQIVSDTSPISALAKTGWLDWLKLRWGKVVLPGSVWQELKRKHSYTPGLTLCEKLRSVRQRL